MWMDGVDASGFGNAAGKTVEITNPFTGKKSRATGGRTKTK
jgi:hypothetical protein